MTDHTATLDRDDPEQASQINATWCVRYQGQLIARGGLAYDDPETLDAKVRQLCHSHYALDVSRADAAALAVALIRGYVTTHPEPDATELDYLADLRALRRLQAARRRGRLIRHRFERAARALRELIDAGTAHHAPVAFAHPVHNPVENHSRVILGDRVDAMTYALGSLSW